jgi:hypothetical protein
MPCARMPQGYAALQAIKEAINDYAELEIGHREYFWGRLHSAGSTHEARVDGAARPSLVLPAKARQLPPPHSCASHQTDEMQTSKTNPQLRHLLSESKKGRCSLTAHPGKLIG